jgi:hypothetical protein
MFLGDDRLIAHSGSVIFDGAASTIFIIIRIPTTRYVNYFFEDNLLDTVPLKIFPYRDQQNS